MEADMHNRARVIAAILLVALLVGGGFWWWYQRASAESASEALSGSGTIEAEDVLITVEVGGRIESLAVDEGQEVAAGQTLARLDTALLEAQLEQARAAVGVAEANVVYGPKVDIPSGRRKSSALCQLFWRLLQWA
jgi:HlyD family secretion protein